MLIGSNSSGKSTLLRLLIGLKWPDRGTVFRAGEPLRRGRMLQPRRHLGYVVQEGGLFPHLTVHGNLALLPRHIGWKPDRLRTRPE